MAKNILKVVIISKEGNLENIKKTYNNITEEASKGSCIIALEKGKETKAKEYCKKNDIEIFEYENKNDVFFDLINKINSEYICFVNEGDIFNTNIFPKFKKIVENDDCGKGSIYVCDIKYENKQYILAKNVGKKINVSIEMTPKKIWINKEGCFIRTELLKKAAKEGIIKKDESEQNIITKLISINGGYRSLIKFIKIKPEKKLEDDDQPKNEYYDLNWYFDIFDEITQLLDFSKKKYNTNLRYIQFTILYMLKQRIIANVNTKNKHILKDELLEKFENKLKEVLQQMDDEVIRDCLGNKRINYCLLKLKYGKDKKVEYKEFTNNVYIYNNNLPIIETRLIKIKILLIDFKDGKLKITANFPIPFDEQNFKICAEYMGEKYPAKKSDLYSDYKAFGKTIYSNYIFNLDIPLKKSPKQEYIEFYLVTENAKVKLDIDFVKPLAKLSNDMYSYCNIGDFTINYRKKSIMVLERKWYRTLNRERRYLKHLFNINDPEGAKSAWLRIAYFITKPFFRKQIWLFEDKIYKGGDNRRISLYICI